MIVVDIETSGLSPEKNGIWQIGALDLENPQNTFLQESKIDEDDEVAQEALTVTGKTESDLRSSELQSQKELLQNLFEWVSKIENKTLIAHNTPFDYGFLSSKTQKYNLKFPFPHRNLDLHVVAAMKYFELNNEFLFENGKSALNLPKILEMCGIPDERIQIHESKVVKPGSPHDALEDTKLEAECFSRLVYGKNLLQEFDKFPIPENIKKS
jgi:DNA polymerase III epsilon subunit-like protein